MALFKIIAHEVSDLYTEDLHICSWCQILNYYNLVVSECGAKGAINQSSSEEKIPFKTKLGSSVQGF